MNNKLMGEILDFMETKDDSFLDRYDMRPLYMSSRIENLFEKLKKGDKKTYQKIFSETVYNTIICALEIRKGNVDVHRSIDLAIEEHKKRTPELTKQINCKSGCSNCCYQPVSVTEKELEMLKEYPYDSKRKGCGFLDENENCSVYENRPSVCRLVMSMDDPKKCGVQEMQRIYFVHDADIISDASFNAHKKRLILSEARA